MAEALSVLVAAIVAGLLAPLTLSSIVNLRDHYRWSKPRMKLLERMLRSDQDWRSLEKLCLVTGLSEEKCRTLLIEIGARGGKLKDNREGWALIDKVPLTKKIAEIENIKLED